MSHEIRVPMNAVINLSRLALETALRCADVDQKREALRPRGARAG